MFGQAGKSGVSRWRAHHRFAAFIGLELGFVRRAVDRLAFLHQPFAVLLDRGHVFRNLGHRDEGIGRQQRRAQRTGHQPLMHAVDHQRIGIQNHQAEIGLVAADDGSLQPRGRLRPGRIERGDELLASLGQFRGGEALERGAVKAVVKVAAMPAFAGLDGRFAARGCMTHSKKLRRFGVKDRVAPMFGEAMETSSISRERGRGNWREAAGCSYSSSGGSALVMSG